MQFTEYFIDEVLRMWPPATGTLARVAKEDIKIGPFNITKDMVVGCNILGLMHNPKYYDHPEVFNPNRWAEPGAYTKEPYSFIPFSAGPRSCIGKYVALMEAKLIIIHFLNKFDFNRTDVPLRVHVKFLYEPHQENLVRLSQGGMQLKS
jgi:cytochrome P450